MASAEARARAVAEAVLRGQEPAFTDEISDDILHSGRPASKPELGRCPELMGAGWHNVRPGDRVWLEHTRHDWWDTAPCEVVRVDLDSGVITLWNLERQYHSFTSPTTGWARGDRLRERGSDARVRRTRRGKRRRK